MSIARLSVLLLVTGLSGQGLPKNTSTHGAFGFPNPAGSEFIVLHSVPNPERLRSAICSGDVRPIAFVRHQKASGADRENPNQFALLSGTVFRDMRGGADSEDACLLVPESLLEGAQVVRTQSAAAALNCTTDVERRIASQRTRKIERCWSLGTVQPRGSIRAVEYAHLDADALASVIVDVDGRTMTIDLPAKFARVGEDVWRVDDGGRFGGSGISIPFLIRRGRTFVIPMRWNGAEHVSVSLWVSDDKGAGTRQVLADAWYRAPR